jgi:hypothetical protein
MKKKYEREIRMRYKNKFELNCIEHNDNKQQEIVRAASVLDIQNN